MTLFLKDLSNSIYELDVNLNLLIQEFLDGPNYYGPPLTVAEWRIHNYDKLRRWAYPPIVDFIDGQIKSNSGIAQLEQAGVKQLKKYHEAALDVKIRFPKE